MNVYAIKIDTSLNDINSFIPLLMENYSVIDNKMYYKKYK